MTGTTIWQRLVWAVAGLALSAGSGYVFLVGVGLFVGGIAERDWTLVGLGGLTLPPSTVALFYAGRLLLGRPRPDGGLMSPVAFGLASGVLLLIWAFAALLWMAEWTGDLTGLNLLVVAAAVSAGFLWLWKRQMAARRRALGEDTGPEDQDEPRQR